MLMRLKTCWGLAALVALPLAWLALFPQEGPAWARMWGLAAIIFAACKALTLSAVSLRGVSVRSLLAYVFAWPGLDAAGFLEKKPIERELRPGLREWLFAAGKSCVGVLLIWLATPRLPEDWPLLRGWLGLVGLAFLLHFGLFHLLSCFWRARGRRVMPLMSWPIAATSVADFWGRRWNTAFRDLTHRFLFRPFLRLGAKRALVMGFLASGLIHDLVISLPATGGYGLPTCYFLLQGAALLAERSGPGQRWGLGKGVRGRLFTLLVVAVPAVWLFHPPFIHRVVLPFLEAIGAG